MTKIKVVTKEEIDEMIKNGEKIEQIHLTSLESIFKPRGSMQKNSVGEYMYQKLIDTFEYWTDPKYADNPPVTELMDTICKNYREECTAALEKFLEAENVRRALSDIFSNQKNEGSL
jgi:hypothetical protein